MKLSNTSNISADATLAVNVTCQLLSANNNLDVLTGDSQDSFEEIIRQMTPLLLNYSCGWIREAVDSPFFPLDCNETTDLLKRDLDELCEIWEYQSLFDKARQSLVNYSGHAEEPPVLDSMNEWICNHGLQSDDLIQSSHLFDLSGCM